MRELAMPSRSPIAVQTPKALNSKNSLIFSILFDLQSGGYKREPGKLVNKML